MLDFEKLDGTLKAKRKGYSLLMMYLRVCVSEDQLSILVLFVSFFLVKLTEARFFWGKKASTEKMRSSYCR